MKRFYKIFASWFLCLFLVVSSCSVSFADVKSLMIGSSSNALMTLELDDSDYLMMSSRSSVGTVTNTIDSNSIVVQVQCINGSGQSKLINTVAYKKNNRYVINRVDAPSGYYIVKVQPILYPIDLPNAGSYLFSFDYTSDISYDVDRFIIYTVKNPNHVADEFSWDEVSFADQSGDVYLAPLGVNLANVNEFFTVISIPQSEYVTTVGGSFAISFQHASSNDGFIDTAGTNTSDSDYQSGVSSSLSDLSSSVGEMTDEISGVTEAIQNLQGAMEPHYNNVLTQLHHITEQLHAFYDQVYNNVHLPQLNMLTQIKEAIENIDLQIEVDISEVKTAINNMSVAVQNKLQSTTDQITGGYDNSGLESDKSELDGVLNQYEQAEEDLFDDAKGNINDFEFDTPLEQFTGPLSDVSYFLSGLFEAMGPMNVIITFSLTLTIAMVMIGWYRFKGGR